LILPPLLININNKGVDYKAKEILDLTINKRRKDPITGKKRCLIYKIKYTGYKNNILE